MAFRPLRMGTRPFNASGGTNGSTIAMLGRNYWDQVKFVLHMLMSQMLEDPKWSPNVILNGDLCGILSSPRAKFQTFGGSGNFFSRMICWKLNMLAGWNRFKTTPTIWQILRYFSSLKYLELSLDQWQLITREVREVRWVNGCPVELLCITAETIYYRNAPSIFRVSCEIQRWIPIEVAMLCYGTSPGFLTTSQPTS